MTVKRADGTSRRVNIKRQPPACSVKFIKDLLLSNAASPPRPKQQAPPGPQQPTLLGSRTLARFNTALVQNLTSSRTELMGSVGKRVSGLWSSFSDQHTNEDNSKEQEQPEKPAEDKHPPTATPSSQPENLNLSSRHEKESNDKKLLEDRQQQQGGRKEDEATGSTGDHLEDLDVQPLRGAYGPLIL